MIGVEPVRLSVPDEIFPPMVAVRQSIPRPRVNDVEGEVRRQVSASWLGRIQEGQRIIITAGSRGLASNVPILRTVVSLVKERGASPVILGAMGSHGGGTAAGQLEVLTSLGITSDAVGAPVVTSDQSRSLGTTSSGHQVFIDPMVPAADGLVVVNRVKPHTAALGRVQSGLMKMLVVGLGRQRGAEAAHRLGPSQLSESLFEMALFIMDRVPVVGGLALIENGYEETAQIAALRPDEIPVREPQLLDRARDLMPAIPCPQADVLIIEEMGKNYSGTGMDNNVIGRFRVQGEPEPASPSYTRIAVLDLSSESHGNANGIGLADFVTSRLLSRVDFPATHLNSLTTSFVQRTMLPMVMDTDRAAIGAAIKTCNLPPDRSPRVVWIRNTLHLVDFRVSQSLSPSLEGREDIEIRGPALLSFDEQGNLDRQ